jgi:hypothetical protein
MSRASLAYGQLVILLAGGRKSRQQNDIATAQKRWVGYKQRKKRLRDDAVPRGTPYSE